jgi:hypothetical protein
LSDLSDSRLLLKFWLWVVLFSNGLWIAKPTWAKPPALSGGTFTDSYRTNCSDISPSPVSQSGVDQPLASHSPCAPLSTPGKQGAGKTSSDTEIWNNPLLEEVQQDGQNPSLSLEATIASLPVASPSLPSSRVVSSQPPFSKSQFMATASSRKASDLKPVTGSQPIPEIRDDATEYEPVLFNAPIPDGMRSALQADQFPTSPPNFLLTQIAAEPAPAPVIPSDPNRPPTLVPPPCQNPDPELGCLDVQAPPPGKAPILYLIPRLDFFRSNNILSGIDPVEDGLIRPFTLTLLALPPLGPNTYLAASVDLGLSRYFKLNQYDYNELRLRVGIFQRLSPTMSSEIGWSNQQLFIASNRIPGLPVGTRFLNDHGIRLELSRRDQLAKNLFLVSSYQLRWGFAVPEDRSRVINALFLSLNYNLTRTLQLGLDYQLSLTNFTVIPRTDLYNQLLGRLTFGAFRNTQISFYGGFSGGNSTQTGINFDSFTLGVSMTVNLVIF